MDCVLLFVAEEMSEEIVRIVRRELEQSELVSSHSRFVILHRLNYFCRLQHSNFTQILRQMSTTEFIRRGCVRHYVWNVPDRLERFFCRSSLTQINGSVDLSRSSLRSR